jgi:hypothetical protein
MFACVARFNHDRRVQPRRERPASGKGCYGAVTVKLRSANAAA